MKVLEVLLSPHTPHFRPLGDLCFLAHVLLPSGVGTRWGTLIRVTAGSFQSRALGSLVFSLLSRWLGRVWRWGSLQGPQAAAETQQDQEAEDAGQGFIGLERGHNDLGGRGQGSKRSFASTAVGNSCLPCGERCGCLRGQAAGGLGLFLYCWILLWAPEVFLQEVWRNRIREGEQRMSLLVKLQTFSCLRGFGRLF